MTAISPVEIADSLFCLDLRYNEIENHSSAYIIRDRATAIVETGTSHGVPVLLDALDTLSIRRNDVRFILVSHVHLDHAGGAGALLRECPGAQLVVHPSGARHLIDPEKLAASARAVYGPRFDRLFGELEPAPENRVLRMHEGMKLELGTRTLEFYDAPGHAYHHMIIHSPLDRGIFSGDAGGLLFPAFNVGEFEYSIISTSPTQFDPILMKKTLARMESLKPLSLYYTHFGPSAQAPGHLARAAALVDAYIAMASSIPAVDSSLSSLIALLREFHHRELGAIPGNGSLPVLLENDIELNARGLLYYMKKMERESAS